MTGSPPLSPHTPRAPFLSFINAQDWPAHDTNLSIAHWSLGQMIVLAAFARSRQGELGIGELSRLSIRAFDHRFQSCFPRSTAFTIAETYSDQLNYLIDNLDPVEPGNTDADSAHTHLLQILALKEDKTVYSTLMGDEPDGPSRLLRIMQSAYAPPATVETLLADISDSADRHWAYFTDASTGGDQGLAQLLKLGERHVYKPGVARCIFKITRTAAAITAERRISPVIPPNAFGIFFEAMRFVLNHYASDPKKPLDPYIFVDNMFKVVRAFDRTQDELVSKHIPRKEVKAFLKTISKNTPLKGRVQKDLERFKDLDPPKAAGGSKHQADQELEGGTESQVKPENPDE
ncbi:hypothetical protein FRC08_007083 [Ceratobasidium sp. 394]|nr:hypothetical protein FRC08_007083 [Ceratobasidium sp. 394]